MRVQQPEEHGTEMGEALVHVIQSTKVAREAANLVNVTSIAG